MIRTILINGYTLKYSEMDASLWEATKATERSRIDGLDAIFATVLAEYPQTTMDKDSIVIPVQLTEDENKVYRIKHRNDYETALTNMIARDREMILNPPEEEIV